MLFLLRNIFPDIPMRYDQRLDPGLFTVKNLRVSEDNQVRLLVYELRDLRLRPSLLSGLKFLGTWLFRRVL